MEKEWSALSKEEKREKRLQDHISGKGINFRNTKAEKLYKERVTRMLKAHHCEEPDRVPVSLPTVISRLITPVLTSRQSCTIIKPW